MGFRFGKGSRQRKLSVFTSGYVQRRTPITQGCWNSVFYGEMIGAWWNFPRFLVDKNLYCVRSYDIWHVFLYQLQCPINLQNEDVISYTYNGKISSWEWGTLSFPMITRSYFWFLFTDLTQGCGLENMEMLFTGSKSPWVSHDAIQVLCFLHF